MRWIVQKNLQDIERVNFIDVLKRMGIKHQLVNVYAFVDKIFAENVTVHQIDEAPEVDLDMENTVGIGSVRLGRLLTERGVIPGTFTNDNFDFRVWSEGFGKENLLNGVYCIGTPFSGIGNIFGDSKVFVRPIKDNKAFTGQVMISEQLDAFLSDIAKVDISSGTTLHKDTEIMISKVQEIYAEYRFFIVGKKVLTGSQYRLGNAVLHSENIDPEALEFAELMAQKWQPAEAFVLDIAKTPNGPKVVEINSFGTSGFYKSDLSKIIVGIEDYYSI